ncbi:hypothetical protein, partial [Thiolapillus sp.]
NCWCQMLPKTQSYTRACDYRNFETFITMIYMILHEITTRMWFFSALMSELLSSPSVSVAQAYGWYRRRGVEKWTATALSQMLMEQIIQTRSTWIKFFIFK